jgi:hypothetical protein
VAAVAASRQPLSPQQSAKASAAARGADASRLFVTEKNLHDISMMSMQEEVGKVSLDCGCVRRRWAKFRWIVGVFGGGGQSFVGCCVVFMMV